MVFNDAKRFVNDEWLIPLRDAQNKSIQAELSETGGLTGAMRGCGVIRRWTAPLTGAIRIQGTLIREPASSAGSVQGLIVLTALGQTGPGAGTFESDGKKTPTSIRESGSARWGLCRLHRHCRRAKLQESFRWAPVIDLDESGASEQLEGRHQWNAQADFDGPQPPAPKGLSPWEKCRLCC